MARGKTTKPYWQEAEQIARFWADNPSSPSATLRSRSSNQDRRTPQRARPGRNPSHATDRPVNEANARSDDLADLVTAPQRLPPLRPRLHPVRTSRGTAPATQTPRAQLKPATAQ